MTSHKITITVYDVVDTMNGEAVINTYATRRALNATKKMEPFPSKPGNICKHWRYLIAARKL